MRSTVSEIAALVGGSVKGDPHTPITGARGIRHALPGDLTFYADGRYAQDLARTQATVLLVREEVDAPGKIQIVVSDPAEAFGMVIQTYRARRDQRCEGIHPSAILGRDVQVGAGVFLGPHVFVGDETVLADGVALHANVVVGAEVVIGPDTVVHPNATIREQVTIGARCVIHSGTVIGSEGFGFVRGKDGIRKIPQLGTVIIGDEVEIGANSAVDRARFGETVIGSGTKIDNLVQIGHNVQIGEDAIICGMVGVAGSATLGQRVTLAASAGVTGHIEIGDDVTVAARSGVTKSIPAGRVVSGFPADDHERDKRVIASTRRLPEALRTIRALERRIEELEQKLNGLTKDHR